MIIMVSAMTEKETYVFIVPHKSFKEIAKRYNVQFPKEFLEKLADLVVEDKKREIFEMLAEFGQGHGLSGKKLGSFMYDCLRTAIFYLKAFEILEKIERGELDENKSS